MDVESARHRRSARLLVALATGMLLASVLPSAVAAQTPGPPNNLEFNPALPGTGTTSVGTIGVSIVDSHGDVVTLTDTATITLSVSGGTGSLACTSAGGPTQTKTSGTATFTFTGCTLSETGTYTVTATFTGAFTLPGGETVSSTYDATSGPATQLAFTQQPAGGTAGSTWPVQVTVRDASGATVTSYNAAVALTISTNPGGGSLTCSSGTSVTASSGVASFSGCSILKAGVGYRLTATSGSLSVTSNAFTISASTATQLAFTLYPAVPPGSSTPSLAPSPAVSIEDAYGNPVTLSAAATITLSLDTTISPAGSVLYCSGGLSQTRSSGTATFTFNACTVTLVGSYRLKATLSGSTAPNIATKVITGSTFNVTGAATRLVFTSQPTGGTAATQWTTPVTVSVEDAYGNVVSSDSTTLITLALAANSYGGTLTCNSSLTQYVSLGTATFTGCSVNKTGTYKLTATSSPSYSSATSNNFTISAGPPVKLTFTAQPTVGYAGQAFAVQPVVAITDAGGNVSTTTTATITLALSGGAPGAVLGCTGGLSKQTTAGVATFTGCSVNMQGSNYVISAVATNVSYSIALTAASTNNFNVSAPAAQITVTPSARVIIWAKPVTLNIHFGVNGANKAFVLQASTDQVNWYQIAALTTNAAGDASFYYTPATNLWYRAVFAGTPDLSAANSTPVRVVVRQIALLRPTNAGRVVTISRDTTLTWRVTVRPNRPNLPHAKVGWEFYIYRNGHWVYLTTRYAYTDDAGIATYSYTFRSPGQWYVRAKAFPLPLNANSYWSPINRYSVR